MKHTNVDMDLERDMTLCWISKYHYYVYYISKYLFLVAIEHMVKCLVSKRTEMAKQQNN